MTGVQTCALPIYYTYDKALRAYASAGFDDWAITPGIVATASVNYPVSVTVKTSSYCEETFDICWGTSPAPEAMTNVILADQKLKSTTPTVFSGEIITAEAGTIYNIYRYTCKDRDKVERYLCYGSDDRGGQVGRRSCRCR